MEQGLRKYWYNSGAVIKKVDETQVAPFRFSPLEGETEGEEVAFSCNPGGDKREEESPSPPPTPQGPPQNSESPRPMIRQEELDALYQEAKAKGFEEGKNQGFEQGYQEGFQKGKEEGFTAGFQEGFDKGFQEGKREGLALSEKRFQGIMERAKESLEKLAKARKELQDSLKSYEAELVSLAFQIGASIAMRELSEKPESIGEIVQKALERIGESSEVVVKLNPKDLAALKESGEFEGQGVELVSSPTVKRGGCIVETEKGVVDATLETRIREIAESLIKGGDTNASN